MVVTKEQIAKELELIHPDQNISPDGITTLQELLKELSIMGIDEICRNLTVELRKHTLSEYNRMKNRLGEKYKKNDLETEKEIEELAQKEAINYLIAEIIELGGNTARDYNNSTINSYFIWKSIYGDEELYETFRKLNKLPCIPMNIVENDDAKEFHGKKYKPLHKDINGQLATTYFSFSKIAKKTVYNIILQASNIFNTQEKIIDKLSQLNGYDEQNEDVTIRNIHDILIKKIIGAINQYEEHLQTYSGFKSMSFDSLCEAIRICHEDFDYLKSN